MEITKQQLNKLSTPLLLPWLICIIGALFYCYETVLEVAPTTMAAELMSSFHLSGSTVGILDSCYFITYSLMQIPAGALLDRFGARYFLTLATAACFVGLLIFSFTNHFSLAVLGRFLAGFGGSFSFVGALFLVARWLPLRRLGFLIGCTITVGLSGGLLQSPLVNMVQATSWRSTIFLLAIIAGGLTIATWFIIRDKQENHQFNIVEHFVKSLKVIFGSKQNWLLALYGGLMYAPTSGLGTLWGILLLKSFYPQQSQTVLANINAMLFLGWIIGSPLAGWISDRLRRRKALLIFSSLTTLPCLLLLSFNSHIPIFIMPFILFAIGAFSSASMLNFSMISESNPKFAVGTGMGFTNMMAFVPGILATPLFGYLLDQYWRREHPSLLLTGTHTYSLAAFQQAMSVEYLAVLGALLLACFLIKETHKGASKN